MSADRSEQKILETTLDRALADAIAKTSSAVESTVNRKAGYEKEVWAAAEAAEYASLIYALSNNLESSMTKSVAQKKETIEPSVVVRETKEALENVQSIRSEKKKSSVLEGYFVLRKATDDLRNVYLAITRAAVVPSSNSSMPARNQPDRDGRPQPSGNRDTN